MKICLINNLYPPYAVGGAEKVVQVRAQKYLSEGQEVFIITSQPFVGWASLTPQKTIEDKVGVYRFYPLNLCWYKNLNKHGFLYKLLWHKIDIFNFWSSCRIKKILMAEKPDIVETHNLMGIGYSFIPRKRLSVDEESFKVSLDGIIKYVGNGTVTGSERFLFAPRGAHRNEFYLHYLHDVQLVEPSGVLPWNHKKDNWYQKIYSWIMKRRMGNPDIVISPSEFLKNFYQSRGFFKNSEFLVQDSEFVNIEIDKEKKIELRTQKSELRFFFVGSLVKHKGIEVLMQAWDDIKNAELYIVGSGVLENKVREWASHHPEVKVCGRLEGEELEKVYQESDVLIFPSICLENRPTVILEAQKYGLKIIASNTGGVNELVAKEDLVEPGNVGELNNKIEDLRLKIKN